LFHRLRALVSLAITVRRPVSVRPMAILGESVAGFARVREPRDFR
jgi:hypothetical protein